jgi:NAD(P)-dependent dehydrogenase (short-subunit alcohol dehydrogenase family)
LARYSGYGLISTDRSIAACLALIDNRAQQRTAVGRRHFIGERQVAGLFDCSDKVTLVTGGNGGIGLGFARGVAKMGGKIAIWARNADKNAAAKADLLAAGWHDLLAVNLHGAFFTLREGAKAMVARAEAGEPGGSLVYCGSLSMFQGIAGINNYAASKGGMGAAVRGMAAELGKYEIRANSIAPGYVKTGIGGDGAMSEEMQARMAAVDAHFSAKTPIHRPGAIEDFEGIGAYLCSDASRFHSGDTIVIDGGSLIYPPYAF